MIICWLFSVQEGTSMLQLWGVRSSSTLPVDFQLYIPVTSLWTSNCTKVLPNVCKIFKGEMIQTLHTTRHYCLLYFFLTVKPFAREEFNDLAEKKPVLNMHHLHCSCTRWAGPAVPAARRCTQLRCAPCGHPACMRSLPSALPHW